MSSLSPGDNGFLFNHATHDQVLEKHYHFFDVDQSYVQLLSISYATGSGASPIKRGVLRLAGANYEGGRPSCLPPRCAPHSSHAHMQDLCAVPAQLMAAQLLPPGCVVPALLRMCIAAVLRLSTSWQRLSCRTSLAGSAHMRACSAAVCCLHKSCPHDGYISSLAQYWHSFVRRSGMTRVPISACMVLPGPAHGWLSCRKCLFGAHACDTYQPGHPVPCRRRAAAASGLLSMRRGCLDRV